MEEVRKIQMFVVWLYTVLGCKDAKAAVMMVSITEQDGRKETPLTEITTAEPAKITILPDGKVWIILRESIHFLSGMQLNLLKSLLIQGMEASGYTMVKDYGLIQGCHDLEFELLDKQKES